MARRKGWSELTPTYQSRLIRGGISEVDYARGRALQQLAADEGDGFRMIELEPTRLPLAGQLAGGEDHQLFLLARSESHAAVIPLRARSPRLYPGPRPSFAGR